LKKGGKDIELFHRDIDEWTIRFVDTGMHTNIGQRLVAVKRHLEGEEMFLANYADGLTDLPLNTYIDSCCSAGAVASFLSVRAPFSFHFAASDADGWVTELGALRDSPLWFNSGFFVLKKEVFNYIGEGDELVEKPFARLINERKLFTYKYEGFWMSMDTFKDKITFDRMYGRGDAPWEVWNDRANS
jgi:glucose-1-phosphate cytidylyltransferase